MDDFNVVGLIVIAVIVMTFTIFLAGHEFTKSDIENDCKDFSKFSTGENVYECKLVKINCK